MGIAEIARVTETDDDVMRLGRAVMFVHQHDDKITNPHIRAEVEALFLTGKAMNFAAHLRGHHDLIPLTRSIVSSYAGFTGLGMVELNQIVLPALKKAARPRMQNRSGGRVIRT